MLFAKSTMSAHAQAWPLVVLNQDIQDKVAYNSTCTPANCSGHGVCNTSTARCDCLPEWTGLGCEQSMCGEGCVQGQGACSWSANDSKFKCQCNGNWAGPECTECTCPKTQYCSMNGDCQNLVVSAVSEEAKNLAATLYDKYEELDEHVKLMGDAADNFCAYVKSYKETMTKWKEQLKSTAGKVKEFCEPTNLAKYDPKAFKTYIEDKQKTLITALKWAERAYNAAKWANCKPLPNFDFDAMRKKIQDIVDMLTRYLPKLQEYFKLLEENCEKYKEDVQTALFNLVKLLEMFEKELEPVYNFLKQFCDEYQGNRPCMPGWEGDGCKVCTMQRLASETLFKMDIEVCVDVLGLLETCTQKTMKEFKFGKACFNDSPCRTINGLECKCSSKWTGFRCSVPVCEPGCATGEYCSVDCTYDQMNNGTCAAAHTCKKCKDGYTGNSYFPGKTCPDPVCTPTCKNGGKCSGPNSCKCATGWTGADCSVSNGPCVNGTLTPTGVCTCNIGWSGAACDVPVCNNACKNGGTCVAPNQCQCLRGWGGSACTSAQCSPACLNGGACTSPNVCTCASGWVGATCNRATCIPACENGSTCSSPNTCSKPCSTGWTGDQCQLPECSSESRNNLVNATCIRPNEWTCSAGWEGERCDKSQCDSDHPCQNGGTCIADNTCSCLNGRAGLQCQSSACDSDHPCQNGGTCNGPNTCACSPSWTGDQCQTAASP